MDLGKTDTRLVVLAGALVLSCVLPVWSQSVPVDAPADPHIAVLKVVTNLKIVRNVKIGPTVKRPDGYGGRVFSTGVTFLERAGYKYSDLKRLLRTIEQEGKSIRVASINLGKRDPGTDWWRPRSMVVTSSSAPVASAIATLHSFEQGLEAMKKSCDSLEVNRLDVSRKRVKWDMSLEIENVADVCQSMSATMKAKGCVRVTAGSQKTQGALAIIAGCAATFADTAAEALARQEIWLTRLQTALGENVAPAKVELDGGMLRFTLDAKNSDQLLTGLESVRRAFRVPDCRLSGYEKTKEGVRCRASVLLKR